MVLHINQPIQGYQYMNLLNNLWKTELRFKTSNKDKE